MTTITLDTPITLKHTHFHSTDELIKTLLSTEFEQHLDTQYQKAKSAPNSDFVNL